MNCVRGELRRREGTGNGGSSSAVSVPPYVFLFLLTLDLAQHPLQPQPPDHPDRLAHDPLAHLAGALDPVSEHDRQLDQAEALPPRAEAHLDLEGIAIAPN